MITVLKTAVVNISGAADTNENILATYVLPGGLMGPTSHLRIATLWSGSGSGNKVQRVKFGSTTVQALTATSSSSQQNLVIIRAANARNSQIGQSAAGVQGFNSGGGAAVTSSEDTTQPVTILITAQKATGSDTMTLVSYSIELVTEDEDVFPTGPGKIGATVDSQPTYTKYSFVDGRTVRKDWK